MTWFKVDDGFANSKPVLSIPRRYRCQAVGLWTLAGTWCAKELTDGFVPEYTLDDFAATAAIAAHLVRAGLWEKVEGGWQFVGWLKYQPSKVEVCERRSVEAERKRRARESARKAAEQRRSEAVPVGQNADTLRRPLGQIAESALPDPTRPDPTRPLSLVTSSGRVTSVDARDGQPPTRCAKHVNETGPVPACGACATARKAAEGYHAAQAAEAERAKLERRQAINGCTVCDHNGMRETKIGLARCDHTEVAVHA